MHVRKFITGGVIGHWNRLLREWRSHRAPGKTGRGTQCRALFDKVGLDHRLDPMIPAPLSHPSHSAVTRKNSRGSPAEPAPPCGASQSQLASGPPRPISAARPWDAPSPPAWAAGPGGAAMSDWDASSDEELGASDWPRAAASAEPLFWSPSTPSWSRASVEGGGRRGQGTGSPGGEDWELRGAEGSGGPRRAARKRLPRAAAGQARDSAAPLCFHLDSALVGALIGNEGCPGPGA